MRHFLWASLLVGFLAACSNGSKQNAPGSTGDSPAPGSPTQVYNPPAPGTATDVELQLSWQPNADPVAGYRVYFGTEESAKTELSDLATASRALTQTPSVTYNAGHDLGLNHGSRACFRLRAYDNDGVLSNWSQPTCTTI